MQLNRCPTCHARIGLDAMVQDAAGKELLTIVAQLDTETAASILTYISLFRSPSRDLSNDKALMLVKQVQALSPTNQALRDTVETLRSKPTAQLKNHNYLKKVMQSSPPTGFIAIETVTATDRPGLKMCSSKAAQALNALEKFGHE